MRTNTTYDFGPEFFKSNRINQSFLTCNQKEKKNKQGHYNFSLTIHICSSLSAAELFSVIATDAYHYKYNFRHSNFIAKKKGNFNNNYTLLQ